MFAQSVLRSHRIPHLASAVVVWLLLALVVLTLAPHPAAAEDDDDTDSAEPMVIALPNPRLAFDAHTLEHLEQRDWLLAIFSDGILCERVAYPTGGAVEVPLGTNDQPPACREEGATLRFVSSLGYLLPYETTLQPGVTFEFDEWAPPPPHGMDPEFACRFLDQERFSSGRCPSDGPPGVIHWEWAERGALADPRVATALTLATEVEERTDIEHIAEAWPNATISVAYGGDLLTLNRGEIDALLVDAEVLAADGRLTLEPERRCLIWVTPTSAVSNEVQSALVDTLVDEIPRMLAHFGVEAESCRITGDLQAADLLVWDARYPPDPRPGADPAGGFLSATRPISQETETPDRTPVEPPPPALAGQGGDNGNGGILSMPVLAISIVVGALLAAGVAVGRASRRSGR